LEKIMCIRDEKIKIGSLEVKFNFI